MTRWTSLIAVFALFVVGILVGAFGMHLIHERDSRFRGGGGLSPDRHFVQRMAVELDLKSEQRERIEDILARSRQEGDALHAEMLPRVRALMDETRKQIRDVLGPEQQARFDEFQQRHRSRAEHMLLGGPPRGRGRGGPRGHRPPGAGDPHAAPPAQSPSSTPGSP